MDINWIYNHYEKFISLFIVGCIITLSGCDMSHKQKNTNVIHFATAGEYPPFEYQEHGKLKGFDIDLAKLVAKELGKEAVFDNIQFACILPALTSGRVDAAISTITITEERNKNFDFTMPYYFEGMAVVFKKTRPMSSVSDLEGKIIAAQLGSTMEIWLKHHSFAENLVTMDNNNQAIEALKAGHVDGVLMDGAQGAIFSQKNEGLSYAIIAKAEKGYGIAFKKHSPLRAQINRILNSLKEKGELAKLQKRWLENRSWKN